MDSVYALYHKLNILKVYDLYKRECAKIMYLSIHGHLPIQLNELLSFQTNSSKHAYSTRQPDSLHTPKFSNKTF